MPTPKRESKANEAASQAETPDWMLEDKYFIPKISGTLKILNERGFIDSQAELDFSKIENVLVDLYIAVEKLYQGGFPMQIAIDLCHRYVLAAKHLSEFEDWVWWSLYTSAPDHEEKRMNGEPEAILYEVWGISLAAGQFKHHPETNMKDSVAVIVQELRVLKRDFERLGVVRALDTVRAMELQLEREKVESKNAMVDNVFKFEDEREKTGSKIEQTEGNVELWNPTHVNDSFF